MVVSVILISLVLVDNLPIGGPLSTGTVTNQRGGKLKAPMYLSKITKTKKLPKPGSAESEPQKKNMVTKQTQHSVISKLKSGQNKNTGMTSNTESDQNRKESTVRVKKKTTKLILFWTTVYNKDHTNNGDARFSGCDYSNCAFTIDRSRLEESDAVMFHMWDLAKDTEKDLPPKRWAHQRWILFGHESAVSANFSLYYDVEFNTTITYKDDADIYFGYGCYSELGYNMKKPTIKNYAAGKTRKVAWVISHCNASSKRDDYIRELSKYLPVDGYGRCADRVCTPTENRLNKKDPESKYDCEKMISDNYKFYLSFENSLCAGYITEKVWRKLRYGTVPVVLGASNYSRFLPPNSFIDVRDFTSPKELAKYLLKIDKNDSIYNSYFTWKQLYQLGCVKHECKLCEYLNTNNEKKVYTDIGKWWSDCTNYKSFFKGVADMI